MIKTRTAPIAAALALTAATTASVAPAFAAPAPSAPTGVVQYADTPGSGSADGGSTDNEIVQAGLLIVAGLGVSIALAVGAGVAGGAFPFPQIPVLPL